MTKSKSKGGNRFLRFTLRGFLLVVAMLGIGLGWWTTKMRPENRQRAAVLRFLELGANVSCDRGASGGITSISFSSPTALADHDLKHLKELPHLESISLIRTPVTDHGLSHLSKAPALRKVSVNVAQISDVGIKNLSKLPNLEVVQVWGNRTEHAHREKTLRAALPHVRVR